MGIEIDAKRLPRSALLDTTVALRGYGGFPTDPRSAACVAFVEACEQKSVQLMIAAPTLAEVLRGGATREIPRTRNVEVVACDAQVARIVGASFPQDVLKTLVIETGLTLTYLKYDTLIVACAKRYDAAVFVCLDAAQKRLAERVGIPAAMPDEYLAGQMNLF